MNKILTKSLTYDDVQIIPKFSDISSRKNCSTLTKFTKRYYLLKPIIASPMDTVCETDMAVAMALDGCVGVIHRFCTIEEQCKMVKDTVERLAATFSDMYNPFKIPDTNCTLHYQGEFDSYNYYIRDFNKPFLAWYDSDALMIYPIPICAAIGANGDYLERAIALEKVGCNVILIDVANGHHSLLEKAMSNLKKELGDYVDIIAGNVATGGGVKYLNSLNISSIRVGIGGGCFAGDSLVKTNKGMIPIKNINIGDLVLTHNGNYNLVSNIFTFNHHNIFVKINGIKSTSNHEYYVIHKNDIECVTEDNIHQLAQWISAKELTKDFMLIEPLEIK